MTAHPLHAIEICVENTDGLVAAHGRSADGSRPDRRDERADGQPLGGNFIGHRSDRVVAGDRLAHRGKGLADRLDDERFGIDQGAIEIVDDEPHRENSC